MTNFSNGRRPSPPAAEKLRSPLRLWPVAIGLGLTVLVVYLLTLARGLILGDPTEYTFVANLPAIAHPPGYAFITLTGWLIQHLLPIGGFPWRMHLLSALTGTAAVLAVFATVFLAAGVVYREAGFDEQAGWFRLLRVGAAAFAALLVATAANFWQHSLHANPHIMTAGFLAANLFFLTRWATLPVRVGWKWLWLFCISAGLGVTHHPLTVFSFPAYVLFILLVRPRLLLAGRRLAAMIGFAALGLLPLLYYPLRSARAPVFGPSSMDTLDGFLDHFLARGLSESLPFFGLVDQPLRQIVLWSIMRLQFAWPLLLLALWGGIVFFRRPSRSVEPPPVRSWQLGSLFLTAFLINTAFVISLKQQDIMAYLLGPLLLVGLLAGVGLAAVIGGVPDRSRRLLVILVLLAAFGLGPFWNLLANGPLISLREFEEGDRYVDDVFSYFDGRGDGIVLLNNWEFMTPLWYTRFVEGRWPDPADVRPRFVSAAEPWLPSVFNFLPGGPVFLNDYRRELVAAGFRLRPRGRFYQVVEPGEKAIPPELQPVAGAGEEIELVAFDLPRQEVTAGDFVPLVLAMRIPRPTDSFYAPVLRVGQLSFPFTTDSHLITPLWEAEEIIVERFDFALSHDLPAGRYPLTVTFQNLSRGEDSGISVELGVLEVASYRSPPETDYLLANFRQRAGLRSATAWQGLTRRSAPWTEPLIARPGDVILTLLEWELLDYAEESYTIFVHLITPDDRLVTALDYTPLGGAVPTHLWFPKWLPGQKLIDPYRLVIPQDLPVGRYLIEVGMYEMISGRRLHMHDRQGNLIGDRFILGAIEVMAD